MRKSNMGAALRFHDAHRSHLYVGKRYALDTSPECFSQIAKSSREIGATKENVIAKSQPYAFYLIALLIMLVRIITRFACCPPLRKIFPHS